MPTLQQLRYLVALTETAHFRLAAEACQVTQPTLSAQLKDLECALGASLVERSRARVVITPLGRTIAEHARAALREVDEIRSLARLHQGSLQSTIRIGVIHSLGPYLFPMLLPDLRDTHPRLRLYIREGTAAMLLDALSSGHLDLVFCPLPVHGADFETRSLFREPLLAVVPSDHPLASNTALSAEMLKGQTILALERGDRLFEQTQGLCEHYGAHLSRDYEGTSLDTLRQMVGMGMGLSLLPALYVRSEVAHRDIVVARPFRSAPPSRTIGLAWRQKTARESEFVELGHEISAILRRTAPEVTVLS